MNTKTHEGLETFYRAYIEAMLWSSMGDDDEPLDKNYSAENLAPETITASRTDCEAFLEQCGEELHHNYSSAGHDFWLTRNHHGAGFWDGDWGKERGERLTNASHTFREVWPYVGEDGFIYIG